MAPGPHPMVATRLLMYKEWVPRRLRFWLIVTFALMFQLTGGVYLAALSQMVGQLAFISEDVTMASYCSLIGLNMFFPIAFRWKFFFFTRQIWFVAAGVEIACAVLAPCVTAPWMLWGICLVAGYFKMVGMFGCMSTIQLNITPTRNFAVFFPVVYVLVCGSIQISGIITAYVTYFSEWTNIYAVIVGLMLVVEGCAYYLMKPDHRQGPFVPLRGIDWTGHVLWTALCVSACWIFNFGEHYDWWESSQIWRSTWLSLALLAAAVAWSAHKGEKAYMQLQSFGYATTWNLIVVIMLLMLIQSAAHVLQPVMLNAIVGYDYFTIVELNYPELFGIVMGAIFAYYSLVRLKWSIRSYIFMVFTLATFYVVALYFMIDPSTEAWLLYIPMFAFGMAEVMMESVATYVLSQYIPFPHFFQNITIIGFARCGVGTAAMAAVVERMFAWACSKHELLTAEDVALNPAEFLMNASQYLAQQHIMLALKECFGYLAIVGVMSMLLVLSYRYRSLPQQLLPRMIDVAHWFKRARV